jgi:hypothetical protein
MNRIAVLLSIAGLAAMTAAAPAASAEGEGSATAAASAGRLLTIGPKDQDANRPSCEYARGRAEFAARISARIHGLDNWGATEVCQRVKSSGMRAFGFAFKIEESGSEDAPKEQIHTELQFHLTVWQGKKGSNISNVRCTRYVTNETGTTASPFPCKVFEPARKRIGG